MIDAEQIDKGAHEVEAELTAYVVSASLGISDRLEY